ERSADVPPRRMLRRTLAQQSRSGARLLTTIRRTDVLGSRLASVSVTCARGTAVPPASHRARRPPCRRCRERSRPTRRIAARRATRRVAPPLQIAPPPRPGRARGKAAGAMMSGGTLMRAVIAGAVLASAPWASKADAGCGCDKPPPEPAQVRPSFASLGQTVTLFGPDIKGGKYQVT